MTPPSLRRKILPHMPMNASEAINFDTHKFVKHLTENGFTEQQAEVLAEEQVNILNSNLATKADIEKTNANIESLRQETQANIADLKTYIEKSKADLLKWMFIALAAQGSLVVTLIKLLL